MSSDKMAKSCGEGVYQKVIHGLSGVFLDRTALMYVLGLAAFYSWNLTDIYGSTLIAEGDGVGTLGVSTLTSSLCNAASYVLIAVLLSRLRHFSFIAVIAAFVAGGAIVCSWAFWSLGIVGPLEAMLAYKGITRVCAAFVVVAWGMLFSGLEPAALARRALAAFVVASLAYLLVGATEGVFRCALFALMLPASMILALVVGRGNRGEVLDANEEVGLARKFVSLIWRVLLVFSLFGIVTWVMILEAQSATSVVFAGSFVAIASLVGIGGLFVASCFSESVISNRYVIKLVLPLVMIGLLLVAAFDNSRGAGVALVSAGFTCFDLFCFVAVADACHQCKVRAGAAFGWYRALESFMPVLAMGIMAFMSSAGFGDADFAPSIFAVACSLVLAVVLVFDRGNIMERGRLNPSIAYPRAEALYFARQCEEAIRRYGLSSREAEVLSLVVRGRSVPHIAERLCISRGTVKTHITRIYQKFNVRDRQEMIDAIEQIEVAVSEEAGGSHNCR